MPIPADPPRTALITGAARRIGGAITLALANAGFSVAIHANRSGAEAERLADAISRKGGQAAVVLGDLTKPSIPADLIHQAQAALGPLTLLVNNASVFESDAFGQLDAAVWDRHFAVNLRAPVFLAQAFVAQAPANSSIINIVDQRVRKLTPRQFSYTLTKAALYAATTTLAQALAPKVRVNAVAPGPTLQSPRQDPAEFARQVAALPLTRGPTPDDIVAAVLYLATATSVTGETIAVDGGQHVAWQTPDIKEIQE